MMARSTTARVTSSHTTSYRWCYVEQVDQAAPLASRSNGWRIRISFPSSAGSGHKRFNSHPLGGDPNLGWWARTAGCSAADETWRVILCWVSLDKRIDVDAQGIPYSLVDLQVRSSLDSHSPRFRQLNIASFGHRIVRYAPKTTCGKMWQEKCPGSCLAVLIADVRRDSKSNCYGRGGDLDSAMCALPGAPAQSKNALDGGNSFRNLYSILLERDIGEVEFDRWVRRYAKPPALTLRHLEKWLKMTKAHVVVWSHRVPAPTFSDPLEAKRNSDHPHYTSGFGRDTCNGWNSWGPWMDRFGSSVDVAIENGIRTHRRSVGLPRQSKRMTKRAAWGAEERPTRASPTLAQDVATRLIELHNALGLKFYRGVLNIRVSSQYSQSLLALLEVCWRGPIVGAEDARGSSYRREDWRCDINGAHTAALMSMEMVPVFGHMDEVEEFDSHNIEDWTLFVIKLDKLDEPDVFLNADVTPVSGRNYKRYLDLIDTAPRHRVTHFVRLSRTVDRCHIPTLVRDLLAHELGDPLIEDVDCARRFKKGIFMRASGMLQQGYADRIDAVMVTSNDEASALGGKIMPVLCEVIRASAELRTGQGDLGIESLRTGDAYLCVDAERTWNRDGFWALGALILDDTPLRVLEERNALESCGASDFSYQCDTVFFKGPCSVREEMRLRSSHLFSGNEKTPGTLKFEPALNNTLCGERRVFEGIVVKQSLDAFPLATRQIPCPPKTHLRVIPLWDGVGAVFNSMEEAHHAWRRLGKNIKRHMWPEICEAESPSKLESLFRGLLSPQGSRLVCAVTGEHGGAGKSYCTIRAATATFEGGLVLTPTNSLRTSYINLSSGWSVNTADHQLGFYLSDDSFVRKTAGSIRTLKVDVFIIEEAAYIPLRTLSMILAAAHSSGTHVIGTYDTHQLQPVCYSSGMSISRDNVDRKVEMDDGLLHILAPGNDSHEAQARVIERACTRFHVFRGLLGCNEAGDWDGLGCQTVVGAQYRDLGNPGKVHKNHIYNVLRSSADTVVVASAFDDGASLEEFSLCRAEAENVVDPLGSCTAVHAVQVRTVEGRLIIHKARHRHADVHWLYTAVSRATGPSNVRGIDDIHRSESDMSDRQRVSWVSRKVLSYIYADVAAGRLGPDEGVSLMEEGKSKVTQIVARRPGISKPTERREFHSSCPFIVCFRQIGALVKSIIDSSARSESLLFLHMFRGLC
ncbi:unnamed protein product [Ectocarpus sp. CCAP 1310/34]|nr:unnamed protein product [Ectocarpus sp. CCAP 1310/34]